MAPAPSSPATVPLDVTLTANMGQDLYSMPVEIVEQVIINCDLASLDALFRTCGKFYSRFKKRESMILKLILKRELGQLCTIHPAAVAVLRIPHDKNVYKQAYRYNCVDDLLALVCKVKRIEQPTDISHYKKLLINMSVPLPADPLSFDNSIFDPAVFNVYNGPFTMITAKEMVYLPLEAHRELVQLYTASTHRQPLPQYDIEKGPWHFEQLRRLFGDPSWPKDSQLRPLMGKYWSASDPNATSDAEAVSRRLFYHIGRFLKKCVRPAFLAVTPDVLCETRDAPGACFQHFAATCRRREESPCNTCNQLDERCLQGTIAMGLDAIYKIVRTYNRENGSEEELKRCFVWSDGLPQRHSFFVEKIADWRTPVDPLSIFHS